MKRFNKYAALNRLDNKNNKKTKSLTIIISVAILIGAIFYFSFARFESTQTFSLIDGVGYIEEKAILEDGDKFNLALKTLAGDVTNNSPLYNNSTITSIQRSLTSPTDNDNVVIVSADNSKKDVYAWYDNGTIYIYSDVDKIYMNEYSGHLFAGFKNITALDLSYYDTSNVINMQYMFYNMSSLTNLDVSSFDTSSVISMPCMFDNMSSLTNLDVSNFDTSKVTNMASMFDNMSSLTNLDVSNFDTSNVKNMSYMFYNMSGLTSLDISHFDTSKVTNMASMFYNCTNLVTIYVGNSWSTENVTSSDSMFYRNTSLVGGSGTRYSSSHTDKEYAHVDGGTSNPGYFTLKTS